MANNISGKKVEHLNLQFFCSRYHLVFDKYIKTAFPKQIMMKAKMRNASNKDYVICVSINTFSHNTEAHDVG